MSYISTQASARPRTSISHHLWSLPQMQTTPLLWLSPVSSLLTHSFLHPKPSQCCDLPNHLPTGTLYLPPPVAETGFSADDTTSHPTALPSEVCPFPHTPDTPGSRRGSAFYPTPNYFFTFRQNTCRFEVLDTYDAQ